VFPDGDRRWVSWKVHVGGKGCDNAVQGRNWSGVWQAVDGSYGGFLRITLDDTGTAATKADTSRALTGLFLGLGDWLRLSHRLGLALDDARAASAEADTSWAFTGLFLWLRDRFRRSHRLRLTLDDPRAASSEADASWAFASLFLGLGNGLGLALDDPRAAATEADAGRAFAGFFLSDLEGASHERPIDRGGEDGGRERHGEGDGGEKSLHLE
jgi:hypothetical protein